MSPVVWIDSWPSSFWTAFRVPGPVEDSLASAVTSFVQPLPAGRALRDDPGASQSCSPWAPIGFSGKRCSTGTSCPVSGSVCGIDFRREQVVVRLGAGLENHALEVEPEARLRDRHVADPFDLGEDRQPLARVVKVLELHALQRAFA
jgi:hypothetical protein